MALHRQTAPTTPTATRAATHRPDRGNHEASSSAAVAAATAPYPLCSARPAAWAHAYAHCARPRPLSHTLRDNVICGHTPFLADATVRLTAAFFSSRGSRANCETGRYLSSPAPAKWWACPGKGRSLGSPSPLSPRGALGNSLKRWREGSRIFHYTLTVAVLNEEPSL